MRIQSAYNQIYTIDLKFLFHPIFVNDFMDEANSGLNFSHTVVVSIRGPILR